MKRKVVFYALVFLLLFLIGFTATVIINKILDKGYTYEGKKGDYRIDVSKIGNVTIYSAHVEKGNIEYDFTPARRYSFLVGKNEFSHTAQSQLAPIIENEGDIYISDVEECFQVEKVTKEFFEEYTKLYKKLYSELGLIEQKDKNIQGKKVRLSY